MPLPNWYATWIERVSNIVSFMFPFWGEELARYQEWLADDVPEGRKRGYAINEEEYLWESQTVWTFIHLQMEHYIKDEPLDSADPLFSIHLKEISYWLEYIDWLKQEGWTFNTEVYVRDHKDRYQWSVDLILIHEARKLVRVYDWKTWGIAKKRYNLPNKYTKPYSKLKKLLLQLSFYGEVYRQRGYEVDSIYWVWLHDTWAYEFKMEIMSTKELDLILAKFHWYITYNININIENNMKLTIQTPTGLQFEYIKIEADTAEDARDPQTIVDEMIEMRNYSVVKCLQARADVNASISINQ